MGPTDYELRPYQQCPHCSSWDYALSWARDRQSSDERFTNAFWTCERCELRRPYDQPPETFLEGSDE